MANSVILCTKDALLPGEVRRFDGPHYRIALVRIDDEFFAVADECSHEDYSLSEGEVFSNECEIECPHHGSTFDLKTGAPCSLPATKPIQVYPVQVIDGKISVEVP